MERKISIILVGILILIITCILGYVASVFFATIETKVIEVNLSNMTKEDKDELIKLNFLELDNYPSSIKFISLIEETQVRETQFKITFSVDNYEKSLYKIERNNTSLADQSSIFKITEENDKTIYRFETNFTSNTKDPKWNTIYDILKKYSNQSGATTVSNVLKEHTPSFDLIYSSRNDLAIIKLNHEKTTFNNYSIMTFGGNVSVNLKNSVVRLEEAISKKTLTGQDILNKALEDNENKICSSKTYEENNSIEYYYPEYTILKFNESNESTNIVIGKPGSIINEYKEQMKRKLGDATIFENTLTTNLTPIPESEARKIWEEYKHNILLDTRDMYQFKSVTQGKVKPSNYFTSGSAAKTITADFERDAYIYYYCDQDDYERVIGYVDIYTGKVIGGEYSGI